MKLTEKQQAFIANKAAGVTNREAAMAAGYSMASADVRAAELMRRPEIKAAIKAARKGKGVNIPADKNTMPRKHYADPLTFLQDVMNHAHLPIAMRADAAKQLCLISTHAWASRARKTRRKSERRLSLAGTNSRRRKPQC